MTDKELDKNADVLIAAPAARHWLDQLMPDQHPVQGGPGQARIPAAAHLEDQGARPKARPEVRAANLGATVATH